MIPLSPLNFNNTQQTLHFNNTIRYETTGSLFIPKNNFILKEQFFNNKDNSDFDISINKPKCAACSNCPLGTYCHSCSDCKIVTYNHTNSNTTVMQCMCLTHPQKNHRQLSIIGLGSNYCNIHTAKDITNCDGFLKCGTCGNFTIY